MKIKHAIGMAVFLCVQLGFAQDIPSKIPRRSSTQLLDGFGVNLNLPRQPRMPWTKTLAPLFDSGAKWVRIGQYENSVLGQNRGSVKSSYRMADHTDTIHSRMGLLWLAH